MTSKDLLDSVFPQDRQVGGSHYKSFHIQPYEFISKNKNLMNIIQEITDANIEDGGEGAFYIFLKKNKSIK